MTQIVGMILLGYGLYRIYVPSAFIVLGCMMYAIGVIEELADGPRASDQKGERGSN